MKKAELIFKDGIIYTMDEVQPVVEAVAIEKDKILYAGSTMDVLNLANENTKIVNLKGRAMIPGLIDAHSHPILSAFFSSGMSFDVEMNLEDIKKTIELYIKENPHNEVYFGAGYPEWIFSSHGPEKEVLDQMCADKPMLLLGSGGHEGWANSAALKKAEINASFPDPIPNFHYFHRNEKGEPTGGLVETGTIELMMKSLEVFNPKVIEEKIKSTVNYFNSLGITTVVDCGSFDFMEDLGFGILSKMKDNKELNYRVFSCVFIARRAQIEGAISKLKHMNKKYNDKHEFTVNFLKIINDGTIESRSASMFEPYGDSKVMSAPLIYGEELYSLCLEAAMEGFDIYIHAIGDRAIHETLMAGKILRERNYNNTRITNAHTQYIKKDERKLFGMYNVIANTTGSWHYGNTDLDGALSFRKDDTFTMKEILKSGGVITMGSDFPVDELGPEPMKAIEIAATRQMYGQNDAQILKPVAERLTVMEALKGYTTGAAYQIHMEDHIGSITPGKYADLVVLEKDLFLIDPYKIHDINIDFTIYNGKIVFTRDGAEV